MRVNEALPDCSGKYENNVCARICTLDPLLTSLPPTDLSWSSWLQYGRHSALHAEVLRAFLFSHRLPERLGESANRQVTSCVIRGSCYSGLLIQEPRFGTFRIREGSGLWSIKKFQKETRATLQPTDTTLVETGSGVSEPGSDLHSFPLVEHSPRMNLWKL